jgi:hypothetical protein
MKIGGLILSILGSGLFVWHMVRVRMNPDYEGYASHQVMAMNAVILVIFGAVLYFVGRWREKRPSDSTRN